MKFGQNPEIWLPIGATALAQVTKCSLEVAPLALDPNLVIRWRHLHLIQIWSPSGAICIATLPWIALLSLSASIELVSSSARVTSVKSAKGVGVTHLETPGPIDRTPGIPGSDKNTQIQIHCSELMARSAHKCLVGAVSTITSQKLHCTENPFAISK